MKEAIRILVQDYGWIHLSLGLIGNFSFFIGSVFFLPQFEQYRLAGVWLFVAGSFLMLIGSLGRLLVDVLEEEKEE